MKKITDKRKAYLIVGSVNLVLVGYLIVIVLAFLKFFGHNDPKAYTFIVTNQIINEHSSLEDNNSFIYKNISTQGEEIIRFSSSGESVFIGTYDPNTYIYGTDDTSLYISFKLTYVKLNKVVFNTVEMCDEDGLNVFTLKRSNYSTSQKDGYYTLKYNSDNTKYVYSVALTYYLNK